MTALPCELSVVRPDDVEDPTVLILREARCLFAQVPTWTTFHRELLGTNGLIAQLFTPEEREAFERSLAHEEIQHMLGELRRARWERKGFEPTHVMTVRLPGSVYESLRDEAHRLRTSMNKLCISKLLQAIDAALVPSDH